MKRNCNGCRASTYFGGTLICELSIEHTVYRDTKGRLCGIPQRECPKPYSYEVLYEYVRAHGIKMAVQQLDNSMVTS